MHTVTITTAGRDALGNDNSITTKFKIDASKPERWLEMVGKIAVQAADVMLNGDNCQGEWLARAKA